MLIYLLKLYSSTHFESSDNLDRISAQRNKKFSNNKNDIVNHFECKDIINPNSNTDLLNKNWNNENIKQKYIENENKNLQSKLNISMNYIFQKYKQLTTTHPYVREYFDKFIDWNEKSRILLLKSGLYENIHIFEFLDKFSRIIENEKSKTDRISQELRYLTSLIENCLLEIF